MWIKKLKTNQFFPLKDRTLDVRTNLNVFPIILFRIIDYILYIGTYLFCIGFIVLLAQLLSSMKDFYCNLNIFC